MTINLGVLQERVKESGKRSRNQRERVRESFHGVASSTGRFRETKEANSDLGIRTRECIRGVTRPKIPRTGKAKNVYLS